MEALPAGARIGILTSGGDAPGMNAALRSAVRVGVDLGYGMIGVRRGFSGLLEGDAAAMTFAEVGNIIRLGGTILGTSRCPEFRTPAGQRTAQERIGELGLAGIVVIGGDGSLSGAEVCTRFAAADGTPLRVVGVPASIDNDIGCTSLSIGVGTALNTIVEACDRISDTAASHERVFVVEVMGRNCGYLAMTAGIAAGAHGVLFPERGLDPEQLLDSLEKIVREVYRQPHGRRRALVIKAEGVKLANDVLKRGLEERIAGDFPSAEVRVTVLGHIVRGGSPSAEDRLIASRLGHVAVQSLGEGRSGEMVAWRPAGLGPKPSHVSPIDPAVALFPLSQVLDETRRLKDGTSEVSRWRAEVLARVEGILGF